MSRVTKALPVATGAVAGGIVALAIAGGGGTSTTKTVTTVVSPRVSSVSIPTSFSHSQGLTINQIYQKDSPGVVDIVVTSQSSSGVNLFGGSQTQQSEGEGAGVVYDSKGDILTDEHVVANAVSVKVHFQDGYTASAKVLGTDPSTDVGVIRVNAPADQLHPIAFADSSAAEVGDPVVAIGSPFSLPETTTAGIVSAVGRNITAPNNYTITGAIQTDAAINPGNSGGPLLDAERPGARAQRPDPDRVRLERRDRLRDPVERRRPGRQHDHRGPAGRALLCRCLPHPRRGWRRGDRHPADSDMHRTGRGRLPCGEGGARARRPDHGDRRATVTSTDGFISMIGTYSTWSPGHTLTVKLAPAATDGGASR